MKTIPLSNGWKIESWKKNGTHTTVLKDSEGNQIGNAEFDGTATGRNFSVRMLKKDFENKFKKSLP